MTNSSIGCQPLSLAFYRNSGAARIITPDAIRAHARHTELPLEATYAVGIHLAESVLSRLSASTGLSARLHFAQSAGGFVFCAATFAADRTRLVLMLPCVGEGKQLLMHALKTDSLDMLVDLAGTMQTAGFSAKTCAPEPHRLVEALTAAPEATSRLEAGELAAAMIAWLRTHEVVSELDNGTAHVRFATPTFTRTAT